MKSEYQTKTLPYGFTIIEVVVSILILSVFLTTLMFLYSRSTDTFKITVWKQERTAQAQLFWTFMRKHLEEATNYLDISGQAGIPNPVIPEMPRPFKFHPTPDTAPDGNILAWNVSKVKFDFAPPFAHNSKHTNYFLVKKDKKLMLNSSDSAKTIASLDDVDTIAFTISSITKNATNEDQIVPNVAPAAIGTLFEVSLTLSPPDGYMAADLKIPQNHKFRINVAPNSDSAPSY